MVDLSPLATLTETVDSLRSLSSHDRAQLAEILLSPHSYPDDPIAYATGVLGVRWWSKQQEIADALLEPPYRVLVKASHKVGKCILWSDVLTLSDGQQVTAGELTERGTFSILTLVDGRVREVSARAQLSAVEPVFTVITDSGRRITRNAAHPLWATIGTFSLGREPKIPVGEWTPVRDLSVGTLVAATTQLPAFGNSTLSDAEVKLLAYLIGDGGYSGTTVRFTQQDGSQLTEFRECAEAVGCWLVKSTTRPYDYRVVAKRGRSGQNGAINLLRAHGCMSLRSRDKRVPPVVFGLPAEQQRLFLSRLFSTDGWAHVARQRGEIGYSSASEQLARDVQSLLIRFGVRAQLRYRPSVNAWSVSVLAAEDIRHFIDTIGIYGKEEATSRVRTRVASMKSRRQWRTLNALAGTHWERVVSVEPAGTQQTVAVEVPDHHTYLTGFYEHNTHLGGGLVNWWFDSFAPGIVLTTAPTDRQVHDLLWKEVRMQRGQRGGFPGPQKARLESSPDHFAHGFTAKDGDAFQGHHSEHMLIVFDEAVGVAPVFWETAESMFGGQGHAWLAIFNPTDTTSQAYIEELTGNWRTISMSALEHPNIALELAGLPPRFPAAMRLGRLQDMLRTWTTPVQGKRRPTDIEWPPGSGTYLRPGALAEARLLGRWPSQATNGVWSDGAWQAAEHANLPEPKEAPEIGCDVARFGDDFTSIHVRCGPVSLHHETANGWATDETAGRLKQLANWWGKRAGIDGRKVLVKIDDDGAGGGVIDQKDGYNFVGLSGANKAIDEEGYPNRRSELWFSVAERAQDERLDLSRLPAATLRELRRQALAPIAKVDNQGRRVVEKKEDTKLRIKRSPDDVDAMNLAYAPPPRRWTAL